MNEEWREYSVFDLIVDDAKRVELRLSMHQHA